MRTWPLLMLCACSLTGSPGGGGDNLPVSGAGPYRKLFDPSFSTPLDEPFLLSELGVDLSDPSAIALEGGTTRLFFTRAGSEIWRADLASLDQPPATPALALGGGASAPSVLSVDGRLVMFYQAGADTVARAESSDGGASWTPAGKVLDDAADPTAVVAAGTWYLYFTRPSRPGIFAALSSDGLAFTAEPQPILLPRPGRFDGRTVTDPQAAGGITEAGALHIALFYAGRDAAGTSAIGYAGSEDGLSFVARAVPILDPAAPSERAPAALVRKTSSVLFFVQESSGRAAIAGATAP